MRLQLLTPAIAVLLALGGGSSESRMPAGRSGCIAFFRADGLWISASDGSLRRLYALETGVYGSQDNARITCPPAWSPSGDKICFGLNSAHALIVVDLRGRVLQKIPPLPINAESYRLWQTNPVPRYFIQFRHVFWPAPGLIIAEYEDDDYHSFLMNWDGRSSRAIGRASMNRHESAVSAGGRRLAYVEDYSGFEAAIGGWQGLFVQDLRSGRRKCYYKTSYYGAYDLTLSPGGQRVCFLRQAGNEPVEPSPAQKAKDGLWIATADRKLRRVSRSADHPAPRWSPDGRWISYSGGEDNPRLYLWSSTGRGSRTLCRGHAGSVWTPDSRHLISDEGKQGLWLINVPRGQARRIVPDGQYPALFGPRD